MLSLFVSVPTCLRLTFLISCHSCLKAVYDTSANFFLPSVVIVRNGGTVDDRLSHLTSLVEVSSTIPGQCILNKCIKNRRLILATMGVAGCENLRHTSSRATSYTLGPSTIVSLVNNGQTNLRATVLRSSPSISRIGNSAHILAHTLLERRPPKTDAVFQIDLDWLDQIIPSGPSAQDPASRYMRVHQGWNLSRVGSRWPEHRE